MEGFVSSTLAYYFADAFSQANTGQDNLNSASWGLIGVIIGALITGLFSLLQIRFAHKRELRRDNREKKIELYSKIMEVLSGYKICIVDGEFNNHDTGDLWVAQHQLLNALIKRHQGDMFLYFPPKIISELSSFIMISNDIAIKHLEGNGKTSNEEYFLNVKKATDLMALFVKDAQTKI